ncbi:hypothetical protein EJB05_27919 [Eragrostis curvula]|uniref:Uncharacterized protein n=1 Tax=Eragrostis curvula TaxID=38414 RepID=A0A5J9UPW8_9POAL|nr:hypothetical protein EJB05_27919 [Eragrostis curvula]
MHLTRGVAPASGYWLLAPGAGNGRIRGGGRPAGFAAVDRAQGGGLARTPRGRTPRLLAFPPTGDASGLPHLALLLRRRRPQGWYTRFSGGTVRSRGALEKGMQVGWNSSRCFTGAAGHSVHTRQLFDVMPPCTVCLSSFDLPMLHCAWKGREEGGRKKYKEANESLWNFIRSSHPGVHIFLLSSSFCLFKETLNAKYKSLRSRQLLVLFSLFTISTNRIHFLQVDVMDCCTGEVE